MNKLVHELHASTMLSGRDRRPISTSLAAALYPPRADRRRCVAAASAIGLAAAGLLASTGAPRAQFVSNNGAGTVAPVATGLNASAGGGNARATGQNSLAVGNGATATSTEATAVGGLNNQATGLEASAVGTRNRASGNASTAIGSRNSATGTASFAGGSQSFAGDSSVAIGMNSQANAFSGLTNAVAVGANNTATGPGAVALGQNNNATNTDPTGAAVALGGYNSVSADNAIAIGAHNGVYGANALALGYSSFAYAANAVAIGNQTFATGAGSLAFGAGSTASVGDGVALGSNAVADRAGLAGATERFSRTAVASALGAVSVGAAGAERQITNVAGGTQATDAVNVRQLQSVGSNLAGSLGGGANFNADTGTYTGPVYTLNGSGTTFTTIVPGIQALASGAAGPVQYAQPGTPSNALNLVGTGGAVTLGNVAAGQLTATSTQAVNGSQLYQTNQNVLATNQRTAAALGGGAGVDANGLLTAPSYVVQGGTYDNVGGALGALDTQTTTNTRNIATNTANITNLQNGTDGPFRDNNTAGAAAPQAVGADAVAGGFGAVASGASSIALGRNAQATQAGAVAIGHTAVASGGNGVALGLASSAGGANSVALGAGSSAAQADSVAVGAGVRTSRANQVAIGTSGQTYTLAGLTSAQSLAAQSGATGFVTTDAAGNLAASNYGPAQLAQMDGRIGTLENSVAGLQLSTLRLQRQVRDAFQGTAIALSLSGVTLPEGKTYAVAGGVGTYHGSTGVGFTGIVRVSDNLFATGGVGFGVDGRSNVGGRASLLYAW